MQADDIFRYLLLAGVLTVMTIGFFHRFRARTGEPLERRQEGLFILVGLRFTGLAGFAAVVAYLMKPSSLGLTAVPLPSWLRWMGVGLGGMTAGLLFWTLRTLGKNLTDTVVTRKQHTLVTAGPYRWVRHPFYDCLALLAVTASLITANSFFFFAGGFGLLLVALRTRVEERNLLNRFGNDYREYMVRTGRFLPRLSNISHGKTS